MLTRVLAVSAMVLYAADYDHTCFEINSPLKSGATAPWPTSAEAGEPGRKPGIPNAASGRDSQEDLPGLEGAGGLRDHSGGELAR